MVVSVFQKAVGYSPPPSPNACLVYTTVDILLAVIAILHASTALLARGRGSDECYGPELTALGAKYNTANVLTFLWGLMFAVYTDQ